MADAMKLVEIVAREVDPDAWAHVDACHKAMITCQEDDLPALRKVIEKRLDESGSISTAERILAAIEAASPPAREEAPAEGAGEEAIFDRLRAIHRRNPSEYAECCSIIDALRARTSEPEAGAAAWTENLIDIVEGIGSIPHGTWRDKNGKRLKDTTAWAAFYVAARTAPATADKLKVAKEAIRAEIKAPLSGPTHGAWDRGRIAGLKEALAALEGGEG